MRRTRLNDGWFVRPRSNPFAEPTSGPADWVPVTVPHDAMIGGSRSASATGASGYFVPGSWEYRRPLDPTIDADGAAIVLEFEGVYRDAVVSVNGTIAATRPYGYSTFSVPIDHLLRPDEDNELIVQARAGDDSRWYTGGGIYRDVWLLEAGPIHLVPGALDVRTPEVDDGGAVVTVAAAVRNRAQTTAVPTLRVELMDADGELVARADTPVTAFPGETITARQRLFITDPRRWGIDHPYLYRCRTTLLDGDIELDHEVTTFGIRTIALDPGRGLRINGEPTLLRGACVHHDNGPLGAATFGRGGGAARRAPEGGWLQRDPQCPQPDERSDARRLRPARDAGDGRGLRRVVAAEVGRRLRPTVRSVVGGRCRGDGPQGSEPPERRDLQHRQRDP